MLIAFDFKELNEQKDVLLKRGEFIPPTGSGPIYICTRNNDLEEIIQSTPEPRKADLVFLQNGMLGPYLESKGLSGNTQALVYFAVAKKGDKPIDGKTDVNPEGLTAATGKWAADFHDRLSKGALACKVLEKDIWNISMVMNNAITFPSNFNIIHIVRETYLDLRLHGGGGEAQVQCRGSGVRAQGRGLQRHQ